jgi:flavin-dependent dehydrogenase
MFDVAVVGAGAAGSAAAIGLAALGYSVALIEKHSQPAHKVCGEFLSFEAMPMLHKLGINIDATGARPIERSTFYSSNWHLAGRLPAPGRSLSRKLLDDLLLQQAVSAVPSSGLALRSKTLTTAQPDTLS